MDTICPRCGKPIAGGEQRFCGECGLDLPHASSPPAAPRRFCAACGQSLGEGKFCSACGAAQAGMPPAPDAAPAVRPAPWPIRLPPPALPAQAASRPSGGRAKGLVGILLACGLLAVGAAAAAYMLYIRPGEGLRSDAAKTDESPAESLEATAERKRRFDTLLEDAKSVIEKDPAAALKKLEEAEDVAASGVADAAARVRPLKDRALWLIALESGEPGKARDDFVGEANDPGRQRKLSQGAEEAFDEALKQAGGDAKRPR